MKVRNSQQLDLGELAEAQGFLLSGALKYVLRDFAEKFDDLGITPKLFSILVLIRRNPGCTLSDIGETLGMLQTNLVGRLDYLIERGWVRREQDKEDRRAKVLYLTPAGVKLMQAAQRRHRNHLAEIRKLDPESRLLSALAEFIANSRSNLSPDDRDLAEGEDV